MKKVFFSLFLWWFCLVFLAVFDLFPQEKKLHLVMCDVGEGDAILISYGYQQMLIDGGRDEAVLYCLNRHLPIGDRTIELVVATHPDADHIGGLTWVLESYRVLNLVTSQQIKQTDDFKQFWRLVQAKKTKGMRLIFPTVNQVLWIDRHLLAKVVSTSSSGSFSSLDNVRSTENILSDEIDKSIQKSNDYNNGSIVILFSFDRYVFLFTGDLEKEGELAIIHSGLLSKANVLKVGHHGSKSSSSMQFLGIIRPEISLIGVGKGNLYHHPSPQVVNRLLEVGSKVYRTDRDGEIEVVPEDDSLFVKLQK